MLHRLIFASIVALVSASLPATLAHPLTITRGEAIQGGMLIVATQSPDSQVTLITGDQSDNTAGDQPETETLPIAANGLLVLGFAADDRDPITLIEKRADGSEARLTLTPAVRAYETQRIDGLPSNMVTPPPETLDRIKADNIAVGKARAGRTPLTAWQEDFIWPAHGIITGVYGSRRILNGQPRSPHYGIDIAAPHGSPVKAPASGVITMVRDLYFTGHTVIMDHGHGVSSTFLHLAEVLVTEGQAIAQGHPVGKIGASGRATGPHLDWRVNWHSKRLDPMLLVPPIPKTESP